MEQLLNRFLVKIEKMKFFCANVEQNARFWGKKHVFTSLEKALKWGKTDGTQNRAILRLRAPFFRWRDLALEEVKKTRIFKT